MTPEEYVVAIGQIIGAAGVVVVVPMLLVAAAAAAYAIGRATVRRWNEHADHIAGED